MKGREVKKKEALTVYWNFKEKKLLWDWKGNE